MALSLGASPILLALSCEDAELRPVPLILEGNTSPVVRPDGRRARRLRLKEFFAAVASDRDGESIASILWPCLFDRDRLLPDEKTIVPDTDISRILEIMSLIDEPDELTRDELSEWLRLSSRQQRRTISPRLFARCAIAAVGETAGSPDAAVCNVVSPSFAATLCSRLDPTGEKLGARAAEHVGEVVFMSHDHGHAEYLVQLAAWLRPYDMMAHEQGISIWDAAMEDS